ncbi:hypothetical protein JCM10213v2_002287 [Rhodosporidiobolus nylandii]
MTTPPQAAASSPSHPSANISSSPATPPGDDADGQSASEDEQDGPLGAAPKKKKKKKRTTAEKNAAKKRTQEKAKAAEEQGETQNGAGEEPYRGVWAWLARNKHLKATNSPTARFPPGYLETLSSNAIPPPLDPAAFTNALEVRKLVDEAADLALRASSGLSASELDALNRNPYGMGDMSHDGGFSYTGGLYGSGGNGGGRGGKGAGGGAKMSALRQHRFRVLAVAKLAQAYRIDEVAAAVIIMQQGENLEEIAEKVSRQEPGNQDARYVAYFSEKIPSRALSPASDLEVLDWLLACDPSCLAYYRSKGVLLSTFKQDYPGAIRTLTQGLAQAKAAREAAAAAPLFSSKPLRSKKSGGKKRDESPASGREDSRTSSPARNGSNGGAAAAEDLPSLGKVAGDDLERALLFHRGMAHFHHARQQIEDAVLTLEGVKLPPNRRNDEGGAWTLRNLGLHVPNDADGLYGSRLPAMQEKYRAVLSEAQLLDRVHSSLRRAIRDLERFLAHFPVYEAPDGSPLEELPRLSGHSGLDPPRPSALEEPLTFLGRRLVHHRALSPRTFARDPRRPPPEKPQRALLTAFHPFLLEAHCTRLLALLLLGDFTQAAKGHAMVVRLAEQLEGYPLFSSPRVGTQAEYAELVERLWKTWAAKRAPAPSPPSLSAAGDADSDSEDTPTALPENLAHTPLPGPASGSLGSLAAVADLFSPSFRDAYIARAEEWWEKVGKREEEAREARERRQAPQPASAVKGQKTITQGETGAAAGPGLGSWKEEREKAEAKMRKIDPSYAPLTTAHTELALCYLHAAILPPLEAQAAAEIAAAEAAAAARPKSAASRKGKGKAVAVDDEDNADEASSWAARGSGANGVNGSGSAAGPAPTASNPFGTGAWGEAGSSSSASAYPAGGSAEAGGSASGIRGANSTAEGSAKGKGKGKARA